MWKKFGPKYVWEKVLIKYWKKCVFFLKSPYSSQFRFFNFKLNFEVLPIGFEKIPREIRGNIFSCETKLAQNMYGKRFQLNFEKKTFFSEISIFLTILFFQLQTQFLGPPNRIWKKIPRETRGNFFFIWKKIVPKYVWEEVLIEFWKKLFFSLISFFFDNFFFNFKFNFEALPIEFEKNIPETRVNILSCENNWPKICMGRGLNRILKITRFFLKSPYSWQFSFFNFKLNFEALTIGFEKNKNIWWN